LLKLNPNGLNVIYGPNEAGKTTLMRFVRSVLYGFEPLQEEAAWHRPEDNIPWRGSLRCDHAGRTWRISRKAHVSNRGSLRISGGPDDLEKQDALDLLLSDTDETIFTDVFAVGVRELQQLSTLGSSQVAEYIYGLSLGPLGRQLLESLGDIRNRRSALFSEEGSEGQLPDLFARYAELSVVPTNKGEAREQHARLVRRRQELTAAVDELQHRDDEIAGELKGLRFISSCYTPWKKIRDYHAELAALPVINHNPEQVLEQLDACERDIDAFAAKRDEIADKATALQEQAHRLQLDMAFEKDRYAIQGVVDQADWLRNLDEQIQLADERSSGLKRQLDQSLTDMGPGWTVERLKAIDTSSEAHNSLLSAARRYQDAVQRRGKLRRWNRAMSRRSQQELVDLETDLTVMGIESVEEAIDRENARLAELENLGRLRLQREQMALKIKTVRNVMGRVDTDDSIPEWVDRAITSMAVVAAALFFVGLWMFSVNGDQGRALGGAMCAAAISFAGMMWWGIRHGLRNPFDQRTGIQLDDLNAEAREAEKNLRIVHDRIQRIQSQGIAGQYYALNDGEPAEVADAIKDQYLPKFAGDKLPESLTGCAVALADRLDTITGIFGIGQKPSGSKDPFALRRASLGVLRIIIEKDLNLDLAECLQQAISGHGELPAADGLVDTVLGYMLERFRAWYEEDGIKAEVFMAVSAKNLSQPLDINQRVLAVNAFTQLPEAGALAAANKRVSNILAKLDDQSAIGSVDKTVLADEAEKVLAEKVAAKFDAVAPLFAERQYKEALAALADLREPVDNFFDSVMVMADDEALRNNRLALLKQLRELFLEVADISLLVPAK